MTDTQQRVYTALAFFTGMNGCSQPAPMMMEPVIEIPIDKETHATHPDNQTSNGQLKQRSVDKNHAVIIGGRIPINAHQTVTAGHSLPQGTWASVSHNYWYIMPTSGWYSGGLISPGYVNDIQHWHSTALLPMGCACPVNSAASYANGSTGWLWAWHEDYGDWSEPLPFWTNNILFPVILE